MYDSYIVLEIQTNADGTVGTIVTQWPTINQAESKYHTVLAYAAASDLPMHSAMIITPDGMTLRGEHYTHTSE